MFVNRQKLQIARAPETLLGFFYTQRTGSNAMTAWLQQSVPPQKVYFYRNVKDFVHWRRQPPGTLDGFRIYAGFSDFAPKDLGGRPFVAFGMVRHPMHRLASLYALSKRDKPHVYHELANRTSFEGYYREGSKDRPQYFQNLVCRRIGGAPTFAAAKVAIDEYYGIVAPTDRLDLFSNLMIDNLGWTVDPIKPGKVDDTTKYAAMMNSPARDEILAANAEDLALYEYVKGLGEPAAVAPSRPVAVSSGAAAVPSVEMQPVAEVAAVAPGGPQCSVCGAALDNVKDAKSGGYCPGCNSPDRARSLSQVLERTVVPAVRAAGLADLPVLAFGASGGERKLLDRHFPNIKSVSLYGKYGADHESGVDIRDLGRYPANSFSGAMGILLFDYFPEHEKALAELYRVLAPGGVLFSLVLTPRVKPDSSPPRVTKRIEPRPGYFDYIPAGGQLLNVTVGQDWMLQAIAGAGFEPQQVRLFDRGTAASLEWFLGFKPMGPGARKKDPGAKARQLAAPQQPVRPPQAAPPRGAATESFSKTHTVAVDPAFGFRKVALELSVPSVPLEGRNASFAEHRPGSDTVIALARGRAVVSDDLGQSWQCLPLPDAANIEFENCFTTNSGDHLLQVKSGQEGISEGTVFVYDSNWSLRGRSSAGRYRWHGSRSIGQSGNTIMWAEYPENKAKYTRGQEHLAEHPRVWRSRDGGASWEMVFEQNGLEIRHFHTIVPDPCVARQWWLSSGDRADESKVWLSSDDGDSWKEVTNLSPDVQLHPSAMRAAQAVHRYTDIWLGPDEVVWGTDDWLGTPGAPGVDPDTPAGAPRAGARMIRSRRTTPLQPVDAGWIGNPVRSITDVGPALLMTTEAKYKPLPEPQVYLMAKNGSGKLTQLCTVEILRDRGSGFTYSRASAAARNGVFFSFRGSRDVCTLPTRVLKWRVDFA